MIYGKGCSEPGQGSNHEVNKIVAHISPVLIKEWGWEKKRRPAQLQWDNLLDESSRMKGGKRTVNMNGRGAL